MTKPARSTINTKAVGLLLIGTLCIGLAPIFARLSFAWGEIGAVAAAFWRVFLAAWVLLGLSLFQSSDTGETAHGPITWRHLPLFLWPGFFFAGDLAAWHSSFQYTTVLNATLLANLATIFVSLAGWLFLKERLNFIFPIGAATAFLGVVTLISNTQYPESSPHSILGDLLGVLTALFYTGYILSIKLLRGRYTALWVMALSSFAAAVFLLPIALVLGESIVPAQTEGWYPLIALALISHCMGQGLLAVSLRYLPASIASVILLNQPVATAVFGWIILNEPVVFGQFIGGGMVLLGLYLAIRGKTPGD